MSLVVLDPGLSSRVVDLGRPNWRSLGVPLGGAADRASLALGNALVGNPPEAAALEACLRGPALRAEADLGCVVFGAPFDVAVGPGAGKVGRTFNLRAGQELHLGGAGQGMRTYLCVRGGLQTPMVLGSRSGLEAIKKGQVLPCVSSSVPARWIVPEPEYQIPVGSEVVLRGIPGGQADWFVGEDLWSQEFTVSPALDRMGVRLVGRALPFPDREMVSEPVAPGTVQVTRDGQCIILGVDGQTIGGYPKVAQVIAADLDRLGQIRPGQKLRFRKVDLEEATTLYRQRQEHVREWVARLHLALGLFNSTASFV